MIPTIQDIIKAKERTGSFVHRTPIFTSQAVNSIAGAEIFFKCENFQKTGSFKFRGASNAVSCLSEEKLRLGVATHSSGNHAAALALVAKLKGIKAYIVMPENYRGANEKGKKQNSQKNT